ncbi:RHS repeat-associated core domain-containing protein [Paraburkholderia sp. ZP32-5]|uniref:RHS repeat-associated core domain-containing protein n=1 Tax=Paraburkholderia sp. ZP32-5 TaxID=2883245 RepID=UPI001F387BB7|nr:RHS repeat-associated core domain-containing protein [Paraburkholderia sp. ZP32-5]
METGIAGIGGELVGLPGVVLPPTRGVQPVDCCQRLGELVDRYRLRGALSGVLCRSVDVIAGSKVCLPADEIDFALRGRLPFDWSRHYSSARATVGLLGVGWRTRWEVTLHKVGDGLVYVDEYGGTISVPFPERGTQIIAPSAQLHFAHLPDGRIVVADLKPHYRIFGDFDESGIARLKYIEDLHQQRVGCIWDGEGRLLRMRDTGGQELRMHYGTAVGTRVTAIECVGDGPGGVLVQYGYSPNGELTEVRNRIGAIVRRFAWQDGRIVEETDALGMTTRYAWRTIDGVARVVERATSEGALDRFAYDVDHRVSQVIDVFGHSASWQYDEHGHVRAHTDFDGRRYRFDYRDTDAPIAIRLPGERVVRFQYDWLGRVTQEIDPLGKTRVTQYAFASLEPVSVTMSDGRIWMWARNRRLQPLHCQIPSGEMTRFEYDGHGFMTRSTDALGVATTYVHDRWGQLIRRTQADGGATHYERDASGCIVRVTDALGAVTLIERDRLGRPVSVTRPDGQIERHVWNAAGQRTSFVGPTGRGRHWYRDRRGNVLRAVDEEGHVIARQYDAHGRPVRIESGNGAVQTLKWEARQCRSITDADGVVRDFVYTDAGQIRSVMSKAGVQTRNETFAYDEAGRLVERETLHNRYSYRYDAHGELEAINRAPTGAGELIGIGADEIRFEYDAGGRLIAERGANGELRYTYNATGCLVATLLPQGQEVRTRRLETGETALVELDEREVARFWYDSLGRPIARTQGCLQTRVGYSPLGRPAWWRSTMRDEQAVPATSPETDMQLWCEMDYSPGDLLVKTVGPGEEQTWYDYDRRGCLLRRVSDQLAIEYFTWDAASNLLDTPGDNWFPAIYADHRIRACRGYRYQYDEWGQLVHRSGRDGSLSLEWDAEGRVIAAHRNGRTVRYQYDGLGRRIVKRVEATSPRRSQTVEQDDVTRYLWQGRRLIQEQRADALRTYLYQPAPPRSTGFAPLACIDQTLTRDGDIKDTRIYHYHTDGVGTAIALTDETGNVMWRARYRAWGTLAAPEWERSGTIAQPLRYAGQYADEETALHHNGTRFYDPDAGRYISPDRTVHGGVSPYRYAPNPMTWCNPLGRATPDRFPNLAGGEASNNDGVPDPAQQIASVVKQFDGIPGWDLFER